MGITKKLKAGAQRKQVVVNAVTVAEPQLNSKLPQIVQVLPPPVMPPVKSVGINEARNTVTSVGTNLHGAGLRSSPKAAKKYAIIFHSQSSPSKTITNVSEQATSNGNPDISFMDRMKNILELKKIRAEHERVASLQKAQKLAQLNTRTTPIKNVVKIIQVDSPPPTPVVERRVIVPNPSPAIDGMKPKRHRSKKGEFFTCTICSMRFSSLSNRDIHITKTHPGQKTFSCRLCPLRFSTHLSLRKHCQKEHPSEELDVQLPSVLGCSYCPDLSFATPIELSLHRASSHPRPVGPQEKILRRFRKSFVDELVQRLIGANPGRRPQACLVCEEILNNDFELEIHTLDHEKEAGNNEVISNRFACPNCCRLFFGRDGKLYLKDHYNICHLKRPPPSCDECQMAFSSTVCLLLHRKKYRNHMCTQFKHDQMHQTDSYEKLNDEAYNKLAFVCNRCQTLFAGENAVLRFNKHYENCSTILGMDDDENEDKTPDDSEQAVALVVSSSDRDSAIAESCGQVKAEDVVEDKTAPVSVEMEETPFDSCAGQELASNASKESDGASEEKVCDLVIDDSVQVDQHTCTNDTDLDAEPESLTVTENNPESIDSPADQNLVIH